MSSIKTPTSTMSGSCFSSSSSHHLTLTIAPAIELFGKRVWYRTLARIWVLWVLWVGDSSLETPTTRPSVASNLPLEIVGMIVAHLIYDTYSLRACTLTCYSWYLVAVPHLHINLMIHTDHGDRKYLWPNPLRQMHALGLLPLLKSFRVRGDDQIPFSTERFDRRTIHQFSALNNIRRLLIDYLDIPSFVPKIQQYFGHFLPTVRELILVRPKGSCRQIICFVGLFRQLEDLEFYNGVDSQGEPADSPTPVPPSVPPLRGQLVVACFSQVDLLEAMINLFGGIRFRSMVLLDADGTRLLLDSCAETLEVLRLSHRSVEAERRQVDGFFVGAP